MKHIIFTTSLTLLALLFLRCAKEEIQGNAEMQMDQVVEVRNGLDIKRPTFFLTSGTWSNYMQWLPPNRVYRAYNYGLVDSITLVKVSAGNAQVFYTNTQKYNAANFDITIHYKNGMIDTLNNVLSKYIGVNTYTYIPNASDDLIHGTQPNVVYLRWTQRASNTDEMLPYTGVVQKKYNWDIHHYTGTIFRSIGRHALLPERPQDFEFLLHNQP